MIGVFPSFPLLPLGRVQGGPDPSEELLGGGSKVLIKSYRLKMTPAPQLEAALQHFSDLVQAAAQQLLATLWTEP